MPSRFVSVAGACALAVFFAGNANATPMSFVADLTPLNNSGVFAHFDLTLDGNMLTVSEHATGLEPNEPHPQHIHGQLGANAPNTMLASPADDAIANGGDGDGFIELAEGQRSYGPILLPLTSPPGGALSDFPTAPNGTIDFMQTYNLADPTIFPMGISASDLFPLTDREIVIHGMTVPPGPGAGTPGEVNGTNGYLAVLPVSDGFIRAAAVPEPASIALLLVGVAGCFSVRRRLWSN